MSKFQKVRDEFEKLDMEDKALAVFGVLMCLLLAVGILAVVVALIKELFIPALIVLAIYGWGAHKRGWPVPKALKKFM